MSVDQALKMLGGLLLLVSLTLPMASCTHYDVRVDDAEGMRHKVVNYRYLLEDFDPLDGGHWLVVLPFVWPVLTLAALWWKPRGSVAIAVRVLELLLVTGSFYLIDFFIIFLMGNRVEIGFYLAFLALGLYGVGAIWSDVSLYESWRTGRHT